MSVASFLNSSVYSNNPINFTSNTLTLTSLKNDIPIVVSARADLFNELNIITDAPGVTPEYQLVPAGNYIVNVTCCIGATVGGGAATVVNTAQLQIVDNTAISVVYGVSSMYTKNLGATITNLAQSTLYINESIYIKKNEDTNLTLRLSYNITGNACATKSGTIGINPLLPCANKMVFTKIL